MNYTEFKKLFQYSFFRVFNNKQATETGAISVNRIHLRCRIGQKLNSDIDHKQFSY